MIGNLSVTVTMADGASNTYRVKPVTQVAAEREFGCGMVDMLDRKRLTDFYWLAWHAATRGSVQFDAWLEQVDDIAVEVGPVAPTRPAQPAN